jgi:hypothetical protein
MQLARDPRTLVGSRLLRHQPELAFLLDATAEKASDSAEMCVHCA